MIETSKMLAILEKLGIDRINLLTSEKPCDPQAFLDAATDALKQIDDGRSTLISSFPDVGVKGMISETIT
ncbi:hypothetical protein [Agrobacterium tumefaciens]|uniref:Uncharacterized protein n=1 Tax=Agrobacterium tumefaciens TaxID=358 RepID=A0A176XC33_AGRTU|nr:hypothetical protein [Agrobacterium tumefaciens]OAE45435.1 hypothetical protein A7J57_00120 [Agrobacterium tumefaciens]